MTDRDALHDRVADLEADIKADENLDAVIALPESVVSTWPDYSPGDLEDSTMFTVSDEDAGEADADT